MSKVRRVLKIGVTASARGEVVALREFPNTRNGRSDALDYHFLLLANGMYSDLHRIVSVRVTDDVTGVGWAGQQYEPLTVRDLQI